MKFKTLLLTAVALGSSSVFAASDNTIRFQGEVADQTCEVQVNGNSASPVVLLPTAAAKDLAESGNVAGATNFTVSLSGCKVSASDAAVTTVFVGNNIVTAGSGNALGNTGSAKNVALQLLDSAGGNPIDVSGQTGAAGLTLATGATATSHDFAVQYFATGDDVTPGSVNGSVQYAVSYK